MASFDRIDEVQPSAKFGNTGPDGWGFTLWGSATCSEEVHRDLLEAFFRKHPNCCLQLPPRIDCEDLIEGSMIWKGVPVWVWFETVLNHIWLWSPEQACTVDLRRTILPLANAV
jgi:hypothetical protein